MRWLRHTMIAAWVAGMGPLQAEAEATAAQTALLLRKLQLGTALLQRLSDAETGQLREELDSLRSAVDAGNGGDLRQRVDELISRISERYRNRGSRSDEQSKQLRVRYEARKAELASFKEGYDALVTDREEAVEDVLNRASYAKQIGRAEELAAGGNLDAAYAMLDSAYQQLLHAIKRVRDRQTVEYRLDFASPEDEYEYEQRRYRSQKMLLDMAMRERPPEGPKADRIRDGVATTAAAHEQASALAKEGRFAEALVQEEAAIEGLTALLRLMGYFF